MRLVAFSFVLSAFLLACGPGGGTADGGGGDASGGGNAACLAACDKAAAAATAGCPMSMFNIATCRTDCSAAPATRCAAENTAFNNCAYAAAMWRCSAETLNVPLPVGCDTQFAAALTCATATAGDAGGTDAAAGD